MEQLFRGKLIYAHASENSNAQKLMKKQHGVASLCVRCAFKSHKNEIELREKKITRKVQPTHKPHSRSRRCCCYIHAHIACPHSTIALSNRLKNRSIFLNSPPMSHTTHKNTSLFNRITSAYCMLQFAIPFLSFSRK